MLTLYYGPGSSSLISHIALEESGLSYEARPVLLLKNEQRSPEYLRVNPRGKVPALVLDDGTVLRENIAIATFAARQAPQLGLLPSDLRAEAECLSLCAWMATTVHPCWTRYFRPDRFSDDLAAHDGIRAAGKAAFWSALREIDQQTGAGPWLMGQSFSIADAYALVFYIWAAYAKLPLAELRNYEAWKQRMLQRQAVRTVLQREKIPFAA